MATPNPGIFRPEALQYRLRNQGLRRAEVTFPRWMARPALIALWILLVLFGIGGGVACFASVPVSESGLAIVMGHATPTGTATSVAVLMPQGIEHQLRAGQVAELFLGAGDSATGGTVTAIERQPLDAAAAEQRLGLPASSLSMLDGTVVLVWVSVEPVAAPNMGPGTSGRAELPAGSRQAGAFLPLVGPLFEE